MKKIVLSVILGASLFVSNGCAKKLENITVDKNLIKKEIYLNGKKVTLYQDLSEKAVVNGSKISISSKNREGYLVFYTTKDKNPAGRLIATDKIIIYLQNHTPEEIEKKYGLKFVKYINKDLKMALFKGKKDNILEVVNQLNENKIKATIDFIRNWSLY
jgi:uncharacterized protein YbbC (DUF1343 family)